MKLTFIATPMVSGLSSPHAGRKLQTSNFDSKPTTRAMKLTFIATLIVFGMSAVPAADADRKQAQVFRAGAAAVDITPKTFPRIIAGGFLEGRANKAVDKLHSRALVLDDGKTPLAMVIVDTCMMPQSLIDEAKALASKECGLPVTQMMVSAPHTHSAPSTMGCLGTRMDKEYAAYLTPLIAESIVRAFRNLQPARIGFGSVDDWRHTHNRRWIRQRGRESTDPFGQKTARANMHPGHLSKDIIRPSGPVDPQLSVISVQHLDGKPLAVFANYAQHYFGAPAVSADCYGEFCRMLANRLQESGEGSQGFVAALSQGTSGDCMWMDYGAAQLNFNLQSYSAGLVDSAIKALDGIAKHETEAPLGIVEKKLELAYRVPDEERLTWARPHAAKVVDGLAKNQQEVYAMEALIIHERQRTSLKLQALRIGDLSITTFPNEVYAITGLKLRALSPMPHHVNIELANGAEGYIPPREQHRLGGYTT